jgi:ribosomal protein S26
MKPMVFGQPSTKDFKGRSLYDSYVHCVQCNTWIPKDEAPRRCTCGSLYRRKSKNGRPR